ncbi:MAG TPA: DUF1990 domain-containing protein [Pirellulales bacterium]|jgi:uncharacterized protein (UPF0548 family)
MLAFRQPTDEQIAAFLRQQNSLDFTYREVGATAGSAPPGYFVSHTRVQIGSGKAAFASAVRALESWQQFKLGWVTPCPDCTPIRTEEAIAIIGHLAGVWYLNACRIVYVMGDPADRKYGFAYGTLPDHVASGEERFLVEMDEGENVWYDIFAFSRPRHPLAKVGRPCLRRMQRRFARESSEAMVAFVGATTDQ